MPPIKRIRVLVLGDNDFPLAPPVDVTDADTLSAIKTLIEQEAAKPRVTHAYIPVIRATVRTGIATLVRTLRLKPTRITDDGRLEAVKK